VVARPENPAACAAWCVAEESDRRAEFVAYAESVRESVAACAGDLAAGRSDLIAWRGRVSALLSPVPFRAAVAATGGAVGPASWDLALVQAGDTYRHVALFADRLAACEEDWARDAPRRADLYAQSGFSALEEHRRLAAKEAGADEERSECAPECRECDECRKKAEFGWQPLGRLPASGDCPCATRCRCTFEFRCAAAHATRSAE
jgi:hypothetical protein